MAKKNTASKPAPTDDRAMIVQLKGTVAFRDWLNKLAEFDRTSAVQVTEKALVEYAKKIGFNEVAPKR